MALADYVPDHVIASTLQRLRGQFCTPPGMDRELVRLVQDRRLARFVEWPSGHWKITEQGEEFLAASICS